jgi:hypothetical protein
VQIMSACHSPGLARHGSPGQSLISMSSPLAWWLFKKGSGPGFVPESTWRQDIDEGFGRIRCPLCAWQPTSSSVWVCWSGDTPESFFGGCWTTWNTFTTRGRCPGCTHQWQWTSCHGCGLWSRHVDWYAERQ